jgi:putative chitinase
MDVLDILSNLFAGQAPADASLATPVAPQPALAGIFAVLPAAIRTVAPKLSVADVQAWAAALAPAMQAVQINTPRRAALFLGNLAEETGGFQAFQENLHYTTAARLCAVWPSRFPSVAAATPYLNNPEKLANHVYAGRLGNGDEASGDGWRYRGQGPIQLTGKSTFAAWGTTMGKSADEAAAIILTPAGGAQSACWYWNTRNLNPLADAWNVPGVTQKINGGLTNEALRLQLSTEELKVFGGAS